MRVDKSVILVNALVGITLLSATILSSTITSATAENTDIIDQVNVTVPVSCSMEATGMDSHITQLHNNEYNSNVGTTNAKAYCNDVNGFAIYAIGYTDDTDGKNVLTDSNLASTNDITTGVTTSGDYSKWAMKLTIPTSPTPTYPLSIQNNFDSFHTVPDDYTMVAKRTSATDAGSSAIGSTFTTTYQIYIGPTQSAGTYEGQVKYVLVHPDYVDQETMRNAVTVVFDGNGLTFLGGATTNTVKYANLCEPGGYGYVGNTTYTTIGTSNLNSDGTQNQNSPYTDNEHVLQTFTLPGADKVKVVVDYGTTSGTAEAIAIEGTWDGDWDNFNADWDNDWIYYDDNASGTVTRIVNGNTVTIFSDSWNTPESGYDYGYYFKVYPVYNTEQPNTTYEELPSTGNCSIVPISGNYESLNDTWYSTIDSNKYNFVGEDEIKNFIEANGNLFSDTPTTLYRGLTWDEAYANAEKTKTGNYYTVQDADDSICSVVGIGQHTSVLDNRDNTVYNISKLKDGNCWFLDNLALDLTDTNVQSALSSSNTNALNETINYLIGVSTGTSSDRYARSAVTTDWSSNDSVEYPKINKESKNIIPANSSLGNGNHKVGIYYNYCAASAGSYCYNITKGSTSADEDICPINWSLPEYRDFDNLITAYNLEIDWEGADGLPLDTGTESGVRYNLSLPYSGWLENDGGFGGGEQGISSIWWSSSILQMTHETFAKHLSLTGDHFQDVSYGFYTERDKGASIRCMLPTNIR